MAKNCKHNHECESCIREEINALESKVRELRAKLPSQVINMCNHGCRGFCNHWMYTTPSISYFSNALAGQAGTAYVVNRAGSASSIISQPLLNSATSSPSTYA